MLVRNSILVLLYILIPAWLTSQTGPYTYDHIGASDGLSSQLIRNVKEDNNGHLWMTTYKDLNVHDGYNTTIYNSKNSALGQDHFGELLKDENGMIWVLQVKNQTNVNLRNTVSTQYEFQITIVDPSARTFIKFQEYVDRQILEEAEIISVFQRGSQIFILTRDQELYEFSDSLRYVLDLPSNSTFVGISGDNQYCSIGVDHIIREYDFSHQLKTSYDHLELEPTDYVMVGRNGNLFCIDKTKTIFQGLTQLAGGKQIEFRNYEQNPESLHTHSPNNRNFKIEMYDDHISVIAFFHQLHIDQNGKDVFTELDIDYRTVSDIEIGHNNNLYIATNLGVWMIKYVDKVFRSFREGSDMNSVRSMLKYDDLVITSDAPQKVTAYSPNGTYNVDFINNQTKYAITYYRDPINKDHVWAGGWIDNHMELIDLRTESIDHLPEHPPLLITGFHRSSNTNNLYAHGEAGMYRIEDDLSAFHEISIFDDSVLDQSINHIVEKDNKLWIGTNHGLFVFDENNNRFTASTFNQKLTDLKVTFLHVDKEDNNILWIGTSHNGVLRLDIEQDLAENFTTQNGLSNDNVHYIFEDHLSRLWVSTNKYINCINKQNKNIHVFTESDGLNHEEFNKWSYFYDEQEGELYLGGLDGFNYFQPDSIHISEHSNIIAKVSGANKITKSGNKEPITLDVEKTSLTFAESDLGINLYLTTNDIFKTEQRLYYYRIRGITNEWIKLSGNELMLGRLPYGKHQLEIISDKDRPRKKSRVLTVELDFVRPFYKSNVFYLFIALLIAAASYFWYKGRIKRISERNKELETKVKLRTQELKAANNTKNKILTILSHDMKGPIGGLRNYYEKLEYLLRKGRVEDIKQISSISQSKILTLENTLDNLLIWALEESESLESSPELLSLQFEIDSVIDLFAYIIQTKNIEIVNRLRVLDQVMVDKNILQTILRNVTHNALKFSYPGGKIVFENVTENAEAINLEVRDNGVGLNKDNIESHENEIADNGKGYGVGLALCKDLSIRANIDFKLLPNSSNGSTGTTASLTIPKQKVI